MWIIHNSSLGYWRHNISRLTLFAAGPGSGVRLVPTRLSNGDIALVLPAGVTANTLGAVPTLVPLSPRDASSSASSEPRCYSPASSGWGSPPPSEDPAPLALVTRKQPPDDKPWRPWWHSLNSSIRILWYNSCTCMYMRDRVFEVPSIIFIIIVHKMVSTCCVILLDFSESFYCYSSIIMF